MLSSNSSSNPTIVVSAAKPNTVNKSASVISTDSHAPLAAVALDKPTFARVAGIGIKKNSSANLDTKTSCCR